MVLRVQPNCLGVGCDGSIRVASTQKLLAFFHGLCRRFRLASHRHPRHQHPDDQRVFAASVKNFFGVPMGRRDWLGISKRRASCGWQYHCQPPSSVHNEFTIEVDWSTASLLSVIMQPGYD
jgi:hypothetical protein